MEHCGGGGGGGRKVYVGRPSQIIGGPGPPLPTPMYKHIRGSNKTSESVNVQKNCLCTG